MLSAEPIEELPPDLTDAPYGPVVPTYVAEAGIKDIKDLGPNAAKFNGKFLQRGRPFAAIRTRHHQMRRRIETALLGERQSSESSASDPLFSTLPSTMPASGMA